MAARIPGWDLEATRWPSESELKLVKEIQAECEPQIRKLRYPDPDVVGELRVLRFLRGAGGTAAAGKTWFQNFLEFRSGGEIVLGKTVEDLRAEVVNLSVDEFVAFLDWRRSPYSPTVCLFFDETDDGHMVAYGDAGFPTQAFVDKRPPSHTLMHDLALAYQVFEWTFKRLDDLSRKNHVVSCIAKVINLGSVGTGDNKLPIFVPALRDFAKTHGPKIFKHWCEQDMLIVGIRAPFAMRAVFSFARTFKIISDRQAKRVNLFPASRQKEAEAVIYEILPRERWPRALGGERDVIPFVSPAAYKLSEYVAAWLAGNPSPKQLWPPATVEKAPIPATPAQQAVPTVPQNTASLTLEPSPPAKEEPAIAIQANVAQDTVADEAAAPAVVEEKAQPSKICCW